MVRHPAKEPQEPTAPKELTVEYVEAPGFRTAFVDGAEGGVTPNNVVHITFYSEHLGHDKVTRPIIEVADNAVLVGAEERERGFKLIKTQEFSMYVTERGLESLVTWLGAKLAQIKGGRTTALQEER